MIRTTFAAVVLAVLTVPAYGAELAKGVIKSVTPAQNQFVFKDVEGKDFTFQCPAGCKVICATDRVKEREKPEATTEKAHIADLKEGDTVSVAYEKQGDQLRARAVLRHQGDYRDAFLVMGKVKEPATGDGPMTVADATGKDMRLRVADDVPVQIDGKQAKASALKSGDQVLVVYEKVGNEFKAREICSMQDRR